MNMDTCVKEIVRVDQKLFRAVGRMIEQKNLRHLAMITATGGCATRSVGSKYPKGVIERMAIENIKAVNGDKFLVRQRHKKFPGALGQAREK